MDYKKILFRTTKSSHAMKKNRKTEIGLQRSIATILGHMAFFGYDVSELSDEEIEVGVAEYGKRLAKCGLSTEEVATGFQRISNALKVNDKGEVRRGNSPRSYFHRIVGCFQQVLKANPDSVESSQVHSFELVCKRLEDLGLLTSQDSSLLRQKYKYQPANQ